MPRAERIIVSAAVGVLALLNLGVFLLGDRPLQTDNTSLYVPMLLSQDYESWQGEPRTLLHHEEEVLAPARLITRIYYPAGNDATTRNPWEQIWFDMLESRSVGSMHNFFDSMIASGSHPRVLGTHTVKTDRGPLRTSLVAIQSDTGKQYYLLLWYQSSTENAPSRWQWYQKILKGRLQQKNSAWSLIKIATPVRNPGTPVTKSPELQRLERFSRAVYEAGATEPGQP